MSKYPKLTVAAVQAAPVFLNMDASVQKACRLIRDAADKGAKLVAFPESFLPGYPYWCWLDDPISTMPLTQTLFTCALECPGPELGSIAQCAKDNCIYVCISATEREASSVYCTQFLFDDDGNLLGKHRKLKPMHSEKMIWGEGDASTMKVYETPYDNMGSMLSCEHMSPMNAMIMCAQREEIHIASYPALPRAPINYRTYHASMTSANCYAVSNACYVIFSTQVMDQDTVDTLCKDHPQFRNDLPTCDCNGIGGGNACILDPFGEKSANADWKTRRGS